MHLGIYLFTSDIMWVGIIWVGVMWVGVMWVCIMWVGIMWVGVMWVGVMWVGHHVGGCLFRVSGAYIMKLTLLIPSDAHRAILSNRMLELALMLLVVVTSQSL